MSDNYCRITMKYFEFSLGLASKLKPIYQYTNADDGNCHHTHDSVEC